MKAAMVATDLVASGSANIVLAGGMESMTNAPYLLEKARGGYRIGHGRIIDHMMMDGLEDAYDKGRAMGTFAEDTAQHYQFTREAQDNYALTSLSRAQKAIAEGRFDAEIVEIDMVKTDEQPGKARPEKIPHLKPAFRDGGTVTAANSSSISDGAAALVITRMSEAEKRGMTPLAIIHGHASHAQEPNWFTTAPVYAMRKLFEKTGWSKDDIDLYEINEAFAVVPMAAMHELGISHDVVNINGGACALGHPIGASGARIMVTLLNALKANGLKKGVGSLCIGGGEATAMAVELV
jgi:acetyl-CoA C-acetyltransferase